MAKSKARPAPLEDTGIQAEKPGKKKNKRERKEERQNSKKEKKEFQLQSQQENFGFKKGKKSKKDKVKPGAESETMPQSTLVKGTKKKQRIASVELEMNGSGFHLNEPGTKAKKRKHSVSEGTKWRGGRCFSTVSTKICRFGFPYLFELLLVMVSKFKMPGPGFVFTSFT